MKKETVSPRSEWRTYVFVVRRRPERSSVLSPVQPRRVCVRAPGSEAARAGAGVQADELCTEGRIRPWEMISALRPIGHMEKSDFFQILGTSLLSGRSLVHALSSAARQACTPRMRGVLGCLILRVGRGVELQEVMQDFPTLFPASQIALVRAASQAGLSKAGEVYKRLAVRLQSDGRLGSKVAAAMAYPVTLLGMSVLASAILELKALPPMVELFQSMGAPLPGITQVFYETARLLTEHAVLSGALLGLATVSAVILVPRAYRAAQTQRLLLKLWFIGPLLQARALARALSTFVLLKQSGVCTREIFTLSADASGNAAIADFFKAAYRRVSQGEDLGEAFLAERHVLGNAGVRLAGKMEVGLDTGELPQLLESLAGDLQDQAENQAALLPRALELPLLMICGLIVGSIMLAMFLPYPSLLGDIARQMRPGG